MNKLWYAAWMALALSLVACSEQASTEAPVAEEQAAPEAMAPAPEPAKSAGGYEPTESERVPGITMTQEEMDKAFAEARASASEGEAAAE